MQCFRCSHDNPPHLRFCGKCQATLPVNVGVEATTSLLDMEEGRAYLAPDRNYPNALIDELQDALLAFDEGTCSEDEVWDIAEELRERFQELAGVAPEMLQAVRDQLSLAQDDEEAHNLAYLIQFGCQRFSDALQELQNFLENDQGDPDQIVLQLQSANDYLCHSATLSSAMLAREDTPASPTDAEE